MEQAKDWIMTLIKRAINKSAKEIQIRMHKVKLCFVLVLICTFEALHCDYENFLYQRQESIGIR